MRFEDIKAGNQLLGLDLAGVCSVRAVAPISSDSVQIFYKTPEGTTKERLVSRNEAASLEEAVSKRPWAFEGDGQRMPERTTSSSRAGTR